MEKDGENRALDPQTPSIQEVIAMLWKITKEKIVNPVRRAAFQTVYKGHLPLSFCDCSNWGDALSPVLCQYLSGLPIKKMLWHHQNRYLAIGSILGQANARAEVWGSGFIRQDEKLAEPPKKIHAVRGPRTRESLLKQGIDCPEVYGDPALLFPFFYNPLVEKKFAVGIIPHYSDKSVAWLKHQGHDPSVRIIDVEGGIEQFVREIKSCELIVSSSLHGLICADAYGVPNVWVKLSDQLMGGDFKFCDYYESVGRDTPVPFIPQEKTPLSDIVLSLQPYEIKINLRPLVKSCPFINREVLDDLLVLLSVNN